MKWAVAFSILAAGIIGTIAWYFGYFPNHVDDLTFVSVEPIREDSSRDNLRLRFRSNQNLRALVESSGAWGAWAFVSFCPWRHNPWVSIGRVSHNGVGIGTTLSYLDTPQIRAEVASTSQKQGPFFYDVEFGYHEQLLTYKDTYGGTSSRPFPLPQSIQDLCVKIIGDGGPPGFRGNVIVIPEAALKVALKGFKPEPLGQEKWKDDPTVLACEPRSFKSNQRLTLKFGSKHGSGLSVHRISDNTWWLLVSAAAPAEDHLLMTEAALSETKQLNLDSGVTGFQWWSAESPQQRVFTQAGDYLIYLAPPDTGTNDAGTGVACLVHYSG